jgi:alkylated DNA repair dioxygenase AlkB
MIRRIYDAEMSDVILDHLLTLPVEYREYKRYNKVVCVPRGQLAFTTSSSIHYDYGKVSGGTPSVLVLKQGDRLMDITTDVNKALGTEFNTILMNVYRDGSDYISAHKDNTTGWVEGTGFATLSFGATRDFIIKSDDGERRVLPHECGTVIHMEHPMNDTWTHEVPKRKREKTTRVSLTFRTIKQALT